MDEKWKRRFLELAKHVSGWSKDPSTKIGAVIIDPETKNIIGIGYNGFPRGVNDDIDLYKNRDEKLKYVVHAEVNAILNSNKSVRGCWIFIYPTIMIPNCCNDCTKLIIQSGISRVIQYSSKNLSDRWQESAKYSKQMLLDACVRVEIIEESEIVNFK